MRLEFAATVDPIFAEVLRVTERIERGACVWADVKPRITRVIDAAEVNTDISPQEWKLAKLALCAWIDALLIATPWEGQDWWKNNCLEMHYFDKRVAHGEFFQWAIEAESLSRKDALEVFYLAVVLGFRGFYADTGANFRSDRIRELRLPSTIEAWCQSTAKKLHLRQGRPNISEAVERPNVIVGSLKGRAKLSIYAATGAAFAAMAIGTAVIVYQIDIFDLF